MKASSTCKLALLLVVALGLFALAGCASNQGSSASTPSSTPASSQPSASPSSPSSTAKPDVLPESEWGTLLPAMGDDALSFANRMQGELPIKASVTWQGEGGGEPVWYEDEADIVAVFNALASSNVGEEVQTVTTDDYTSIGFEFADGTAFAITFESMTLEVHDGNSWKYYMVEPSAELTEYARQARDYTESQYE